nr:two-component regulator propeller domain-containing protein [uncultured Carboxylicivirga sp.]
MQRFYLLVFVILLSISIKAERILEFSKLSEKDGLLSSRANAILQDSKGYIWIGTWNGLNRYDGHELKEYVPDFRDSTTLSNREVVALCEGTNDKLWIGTTSGLNCLNLRTNQMCSFPFKNRIVSLFEDQDGLVWVGKKDGGLTILNPETGERDDYFLDITVSDICYDSRGIYWLATYQGLVRFNKQTRKFRTYKPDVYNENSISNLTVTQVKEDADGELWVGTWGGGLNRIKVSVDSDDLQITHYQKGEKRGGLSSDVIYRIYIDKFNNIWCGTWSEGLMVIEPDQHVKTPSEILVHSYKHNVNDQSSLSNNNISSLLVDRTGVLWVGALTLNRTSIVNNGINRFKIEGETNGEFAYRNARSFAQQDNYVWVGTSVELKLYEKSGNQYEFKKDLPKIVYNYKGQHYRSSSIIALEYNSYGLWVGTDDAGLIYYPDSTALTKNYPQFTYFNTATEVAVPGNKISALVSSRINKNVLWVGTQQNGIARFEIVDGKVKSTVIKDGEDEKCLSDNNIRTIYEDDAGMLWIGTQNGLNCLNPTTMNITKYFHSYNDNRSINDNVVNTLYQDKSGNLWIGTNSGLNRRLVKRLSDASEKISFEHYPHVQEIGNTIIANIFEDEAGMLWIKPYKGIVKFNPQKQRVVRSYMAKENLNLSAESNAGLRTSDGMVFLGENNGFIYFNPDSLYQHTIAPKVCITDCIVLNETLVNHPDRDRIVGDTLLHSIAYLSDLKLSFKDQVITFIFSAMDYKDPKRNVYAYFLEGYDNFWNEVGRRNSATYTNIPPGDYVFHVKAANSDETWSEESAVIRFSVMPPWWETIWAKIGYGIVIILLVYFFKKYSLIKVNEKSRIKLELMQREKEQHLNELKTLFFTDITHEFRTPLTLIQGPAEELKKLGKDSPLMVKQANLILKNTNRLLRLVNQLMDFRKLDRGKMDLQLQTCNISYLIKEIYESYKAMADNRSIQFISELPEEDILAYVDADKLEKVLYNLVSNAFKYSEDNGGVITIRAMVEEDAKNDQKLVVEIEDEGIGIEIDDKNRIFERFFQTHQKRTHSTGGIGLYLSKSFVELHGGTLNVESELGQGSCFRIEIPTQKQQIHDEIEERVELMASATHDQHSIKTEVDSANNDSKTFNVVVVEDDADMNDFIVHGLSQDFNVTGVFNGNQGLDQARAINPDIIVTDVMMPECDGFEMVGQIRKDITISHIPVVFLTAKTMQQDELKGLELGAIDYISKPFNIDALRLKIQNILETRLKIHDHIRKEKILEPEKIELTSLDEQLLKDAVEAVNKYLDDPTFDVIKFSEVIGLSSNQAYRKIKALTGQTAKEFIRNQRLKIAASLLLQNKRSISEVIYMVGFSSPSYFTRCFKEYYNCTPKEYIAKNSKAN